MNRKQILVLSLSALISLGGLANGGIALAQEATSQNLKIVTQKVTSQNLEILECEIDYLSFEDFITDMPTKNIPKDDMKKLKDLYSQSVDLEKDNEFDKASKKWDEFYKILDKYLDKDEVTMATVELPSFDAFMKDMPVKDIPKDDMNKLKTLYNEVVKLEKDDKFDEANKKWNEFYKILDRYFDENKMIITTVELPSFDDFIKDIATKDIPKDDIKKLKTLYDEVVKLEKDNRFDESNKKWDEFYEILDKYLNKDKVTIATTELPSFDDFIKDIPTKDIPKDDMGKLKTLYNEVVKLEKDNKFNESEKKWNEFFKILDKYFEEECTNN
ncbi:MAG: hypothetical protein N4A68_20430 [Maledivibacter sp.]|jgi:predicted enzyme related to lactoylglutathione lyase|nr:hypothetical protein [Maledivibacter sp.]